MANVHPNYIDDKHLLFGSSKNAMCIDLAHKK